LATAYAKLRQVDRAIEGYRRVLDFSPDHTRAHYQLFLLYSRSKQNDKAQEQLAEFHRLQDMEKMVLRAESQLSKIRRVRTPNDTDVSAQSGMQTQPPVPPPRSTQ
jgi:tetratricopeptide (TPR) repeat protein